MLPTRLEIRNFLAYRQPDPILFEGLHLACLSGPNGAGKSSLLDAITWALWGKARLRSDDDLIHQGQTDMLIQLDFLQGESRYRVVRKRQKGKTARSAGRSTLDLFMWDEERGQWMPITSPSIRETDQKITELLRLDYETFVHSAFLQQGRADAFTVKTPYQRKDILAEIMGLDQWKVYEERAKTELKRIDHNLSVIVIQLEEIARQEANEPALRHDLDVAEAVHADAEQRLAEAEAHYNEVAGAQEQMEATKARLAQVQRRINERQKDLEGIEFELSDYRNKLARLQGIVEDQASIQAGYAQLQAAREADQELGQKLQTVSAIKDRLGEVNSAIQSRQADLEGQARVHQDRITTAQRTAADLDAIRADLADVQAEVERLEAAEVRRDELRELTGALNEEAAGLKAANHALYAEMKTLRSRLDQLELAEAMCPLCGQPLDDEHKTALLADLQSEGEQRRSTYDANQDRRAAITQQIAAQRKESEQIETELRRLPALRERAALLFANQDTALSAVETLQAEQTELRAVQDLLASGEYAQDLRSQRESIQDEIDSLGYDSQAHNAARETLTAYSDYERRQHDLESALTQAPEIETAIQNVEARRERWQRVLEDEQREADAAQVEIDGLRERVEEARRREEELRRRRTEEKRAQEQVIRVQQQLAALDNARRRKADLQQHQLELGMEKGIYEELRAAFGKNGVPAMIIEAAIPELEESANRLLARMTEGRMHVRFDTQRDLKTGGVAETLDILISDELGTRSYDSYSGGEAFRVNFAIRVALSQLLARRAGAQLRTLFLDEGFGTQDESGRQRLVEAINSVQDQFDLLLVITHIEDLRDAFPVQIVVTKTPDGSRISVG
jgi:exonuclease SbcC